MDKAKAKRMRELQQKDSLSRAEHKELNELEKEYDDELDAQSDPEPEPDPEPTPEPANDPPEGNEPPDGSDEVEIVSVEEVSEGGDDPEPTPEGDPESDPNEPPGEPAEVDEKPEQEHPFFRRKKKD